MRALDYLLSRPEVDPAAHRHHGSSGGGTMTTWLAGVDRRWTMAAPSSFLTTFRRNMENELAADTEQCPPGVLARGWKKPIPGGHGAQSRNIVPQELDNFDVRGTIEAFSRLKRIYTLLGHPETSRCTSAPERTATVRTPAKQCTAASIGRVEEADRRPSQRSRSRKTARSGVRPPARSRS